MPKILLCRNSTATWRKKYEYIVNLQGAEAYCGGPRHSLLVMRCGHYIYSGFGVNTLTPWSRTSIVFAADTITAQVSAPCRKIDKYRSCRDVLWYQGICKNAKYFDQEPSCIRGWSRLIVLFPVHSRQYNGSRSQGVGTNPLLPLRGV